MRVQLISVGERPPAWVQSGFNDYAARLPRGWRLQLIEIPAGKGKLHPNQLLDLQAERILAALPSGAHSIALAVDGQPWSSAELAKRLARWLQAGRDLALVIGGPDGLAPQVLAHCETRWSLSPLTFPHALVRVLVAEQFYRAWSMLNNHPYHRA